ncbi:hypothetical protein EVAR_5699_1 [Eumeta japonica]|uniref:Uncharacterized protein n=1 Tax=Eumeta variegata TaxID=151549 RepID=A0A4C1T794_EUMVA|nr:hypothetical protein EVAR_5699_1 [Eumeta japonica]
MHAVAQRREHLWPGYVNFNSRKGSVTRSDCNYSHRFSPRDDKRKSGVNYKLINSTVLNRSTAVCAGLRWTRVMTIDKRVHDITVRSGGRVRP